MNGIIDAGTHQATASKVGGPGSFVGSPTCDYTGGRFDDLGELQVTITSATTGTTEVQATSNILVDGQSISRTTETALNTTAGGSDNAEKKWVDANIAITPATDDERGQHESCVDDHGNGVERHRLMRARIRRPRARSAARAASSGARHL